MRTKSAKCKAYSAYLNEDGPNDTFRVRQITICAPSLKNAQQIYKKKINARYYNLSLDKEYSGPKVIGAIIKHNPGSWIKNLF